MRRVGTLLLFLVVGALVLATAGCSEYACYGLGGAWLPSFDFCYFVNREQAPLRADSRSLQASGVVASAGDSFFLSTAAHLAGALGTNWRSDVEIHNLGDETATFIVRLLMHGADNGSPSSKQLTLEPGRSLRLDDALATLFGSSGKAALHVGVTAGRIIATSRTYNLLGAGNPLGLPSGSTFGQYVPALGRGEAIALGEQGRLIQLSHDTATSGGFRTNLGLVNASPESIRIEVELFTAAGALLGTVPVELPSFGYQQLDRVFARVTSGDVDDGYAVVRTTTDGGRFLAYASVVDNLTGDPITVSAARLPAEEPQSVGEPIWVPSAAHLAGYGGTNWRTDVEVHCWGHTAATFKVDLLKHGEDNRAPASRSYTLAAGTSVRFPDVLATEFGFNGKATLRITPSAGHLLVTSRTYNLLSAGNAAGLPAGATFGQFIPGMSADAAIRFGEEGRLIQLSHDPGGVDDFRTNLALASASASEIDVEIDLYGSDGVLLGTVRKTLAPFEYRQLNLVFEEVTAAKVEDGYAVVRTTTNGGEVFALASVVDNRTGDPVSLAAAVVLTPPAEGALNEIEGVLDVLGGTTIEAGVGFVQGQGKDGIIDILVSATPEVASRTPGGMLIDYGDAYIASDGTVRSGSVTVDVSGLSVASSGIAGTMTVTNDNVLIDGKPPTIGSTAWTVDLETRSDGTVAGDIAASPLGSNTASGSVSGTITIDTAICKQYPLSGSLTLVHDGGVITLVPSPECDGSLARDVSVTPPDVDFAYTAANPESPREGAFLASFSNAVVAQEGDGRYWRPMIGAETFETTTPGVVTYHFAFDRPVAGGRLLVTMWTFHWSYSRGRAFLFGSTDGSAWVQLAEVSSGDLGHGRGGGWNGSLPNLFVGATDIWLQARLYSYGEKASVGGVYCNTAEWLRWDPGQTDNGFELEVDLED